MSHIDDIPRWKKLYKAAQKADDRFQAALVKEYGSHAGDMRYRNDKQTPAIRKLGAAYQKKSIELSKMNEYYRTHTENPKRSRNTGTTVPAHVRINPRNGRIQVFVTPKVADQLRGQKGLRVAMNPAQYQIRKGSQRGYYDVVEMQHVPGRRTVGTYPVSTWKSKEDAQIEADRLNRLQEKIK